jgi:hypothetical protein
VASIIVRWAALICRSLTSTGRRGQLLALAAQLEAGRPWAERRVAAAAA